MSRPWEKSQNLSAVPIKVYDETIKVLKSAVRRFKSEVQQDSIDGMAE